ncbi:MAG TPA: N-acetyl sugar amidotransferase [Alphaproteobacteria bacterium]|nr:N-acetyl sugar amidotransferase [Alphaproteobacteria bacterium]
MEHKDVVKKYNLPTEVKYCKKCVISNQRPRIRFDAEGICSACRYAEKKANKIDWEAREKELQALCDKHRSKDGSWDVIIPCSGGKDSAITAHILKTKYGMHPLTVTWAPHKYSDIGWRNFQRFIHSGFDNIMGTPNGAVHRKLTRLAFEILGDPFQPFIYGQKTFPMRIATKFNIPLIMYGENGEVEYGGDSKNEDKPSHNVEDDLTKHYFSGIDVHYWKEYGFTDEDLHYYTAPPVEEMKKVGIQCHFLGYYMKWVPQENYYYAVEHTNFEANPDGRSEGTYSKYASLDDEIDGFHYYLSYIKFGIGRATSDAAHEIRDGHITRDEGVKLVNKFDGEFPKKHYKTFLEYTGLTEARVHECLDSWRSPHLWEKKDGEWVLKHKVQ